MERLKKEAEEREKDRKKREIEEIKLKMTREKLNSMKQTQIGARAIADLTEEVRDYTAASVCVCVCFISCACVLRNW